MNTAGTKTLVCNACIILNSMNASINLRVFGVVKGRDHLLAFFRQVNVFHSVILTGHTVLVLFRNTSTDRNMKNMTDKKYIDSSLSNLSAIQDAHLGIGQRGVWAFRVCRVRGVSWFKGFFT